MCLGIHLYIICIVRYTRVPIGLLGVTPRRRRAVSDAWSQNAVS